MKSPSRVIFLGLAIAVWCVEQASSATIRSIPAKRGVIIEISGQITDGDADVFKLATAIREGKISTAVESLRIHSKGLERQYDV